MAATPFGTLNKLILAQNVKLFVDDENGDNTDADDQLVLMRQVRVPKTHPESRFNYGLDRDYGHGAPDIGISFVVSVTDDIMEKLDDWSTRTDKGVITPRKFKIQYTPNEGTIKTITVTGKLRDVEYIRNDSDQQDPVTADCFIRVIDTVTEQDEDIVD